jgi:transcriptional regulator with XRE-family HTH domain
VDGWKRLGPLPNRLYAALAERKLKRKDLARIFGVSCAAVTYWLNGLKLGEDPKDAKPIPGDLAILMVRWLETGQEPTPQELAALPSRSRTPRGRTTSRAA